MLGDVFKSSLARRFAPLYAANFLHGFVLWYAIEKLFMHSIGFTDAGIGVMVAVYSAVMLLLETPSGVLADRWSRKGVLIVASIFLALSSLVGGLSTEPWMYLVCAMFWGAFYAMYSGTYDSIIYDTLLEETGNADGYNRYLGRIKTGESIALVLGGVLGSAIGQWWGMRPAYFITIGLSLLAIFFLWRFREPMLHKAEKLASVKEHVLDTFKSLVHKRQLLWLLALLIGVNVASVMVYEFNQLWFIAVGLPTVLFGPAFSGMFAAGGLGQFWVSVAKFNRAGYAAFFAAMLAASVALAYMHEFVPIIMALLVLGLAVNFLNVAFLAVLHDHLPSRVRAGSASAVSTLTRIVSIPAGLLFGVLSTAHSPFAAAWIVVALVAGSVVAWLGTTKYLAKPDQNA